MGRGKTFLLLWLCSFSLLATPAFAEDIKIDRINKLQYMYQFYYLPFNLEFLEGRSVNDILPFLLDKNGQADQLIKAKDLQSLDKEWDATKAPWKKKSLLLNTYVPMNGTIRISQHLVSHRISLTRTAFDALPLNDRIQLLSSLQNKPSEVQAAFKQLRHLRSFMNPLDDYRFNFFMFSASWCASCREYRVLFETYFKSFPDSAATFHSVIIDDPKEEIFDSNLLRELFPHKEKYTHDSIPRFLSLEMVNGKPKVLEEGEALKELYIRFFQSHRGYLVPKSKVFRSIASREQVEPVESSLSSFLK